MGLLYGLSLERNKTNKKIQGSVWLSNFSGDEPNYTSSKPSVSIMARSSEVETRFVIESVLPQEFNAEALNFEISSRKIISNTTL